MNNFRDLVVWQKSMVLVKSVYKITSDFPKEEIYGLTNQIRRSVVSIPSNIAEGSGRVTNKDFGHFTTIALGSAFELETQIIISKELKFLKQDEANTIIESIQELQKMLRGLQKSLRN